MVTKHLAHGLHGFSGTGRSHAYQGEVVGSVYHDEINRSYIQKRDGTPPKMVFIWWGMGQWKTTIWLNNIVGGPFWSSFPKVFLSQVGDILESCLWNAAPEDVNFHVVVNRGKGWWWIIIPGMLRLNQPCSGEQFFKFSRATNLMQICVWRFLVSKSCSTRNSEKQKQLSQCHLQTPYCLTKKSFDEHQVGGCLYQPSILSFFFGEIPRLEIFNSKLFPLKKPPKLSVKRPWKKVLQGPRDPKRWEYHN